MCTIRERTNSFASLYNLIKELSNSIKSSLIQSARLQYGKMLELESSVIQLQSSLIELESSQIHLRINLIRELCN